MGDRDKRLIIDCNAMVGEGASWDEPRRWADSKVELLLERAAEVGIDRTCVMTFPHDSYERANAQVARLCEKYPDKLIGFAVHSPQRETGRLKALLTEEVRSQALKGLMSDGHPTRELLDVVAELDIPVIYYPVPNPCSELPRMYHLMASTYPSVNFILPHLGSYRGRRWWAHLEAIDLAKRHRNIHLEASGLDGHQYLEMAARELPAEQIVFGSYWPQGDSRVELYAFRLLTQDMGTSWPETPEHIRVTDEQEAQMVGGNMQRLLRMS
jgi:predicted TIM-barrel fold metal-dependent hydrolase